MDSDQQIVRVEILSPIRVARAHSMLNAARAEAEAWAKNREQRESGRERVVFEYWRAGFERSYDGEPAIVDLGPID
jgi:hypothetical protein